MKTLNINQKFTNDEFYLEVLKKEHTSALYNLKKRNKEYFKPFQPTQSDIHISYEMQLRMIRRGLEELIHDKGYLFGVFSIQTKALIGYINLGNVARGAFQNVMLNFALDEAWDKKENLAKILSILNVIVFTELKFHRMQCAVLPRNVEVVEVLEENSFKNEGCSQRYLKINDKWEDHLIYAKIIQDI